MGASLKLLLAVALVLCPASCLGSVGARGGATKQSSEDDKPTYNVGARGGATKESSDDKPTFTVCLPNNKLANALSRCSECESRFRCKVCADGYALDANGACDNLCAPGYQWTEDRTLRGLAKRPSCTPCPSGHASPGGDTDMAKCTACAAGTFSAAGSGGCSPCAAGTFSAAGSDACTQCPHNGISGAGAASCTACSAGSQANSAQTVCECQTGFGYDADTKVCSQCFPGSYKDAVGNTPCSACAAGTSSSIVGASSCEACPAGTYSGAGSSTCDACAAGTYSDMAGSAQCSQCLGHSISAAGAMSCTACTSGAQASADKTLCECKVGFGYNSPDATCSQCQAGFHKESVGNTGCNACTGNTFSAAGAATCTQCTADSTANDDHDQCDCNIGFGYDDASNTCSACAAGHFKDTVANSICSACAAGQTSTAGASSCSLCPAGTFSSAAGSPQCSPCTGNAVSTAAGATACMACSTGSESNSGQTMCVCRMGYGLATGGSCTKCSPGYFKATADNSACSACARNTYSTAVGSVSSSACSACALGTFSALGSASCTTNTGFEAASLDGWTTQGLASSLQVICDATAPEGSCYARLSTAGTSPATAPNKVSRSDFIITTANNAGSYEMSFWHKFVAGDYLPYNDYLRVSVKDLNGDVLGSAVTDVAAVGTNGNSGWRQYFVPIGPVPASSALLIQVEAEVSNGADAAGNSFGYVDGFALKKLTA